MGDRHTQPPRASFGDGGQRLIAEDVDLVATLEGVAAAGCALLDACDAASITIIQRGRPLTVAATDDLAAQLDQAQYDIDAGPCVDAARNEELIVVPRVVEERRWPLFAEAAQRSGVGSALSVPLLSPAPDTFGGFNCYARVDDAFDEHDVRIVQGFAGRAGVVVSNAVSFWSAYDEAANLAKAMEHRAVIEQAKGILMGQQRCSADEAFDLLRRASQRENRKLRDIALDLVARTVKGEDQ